MHGPSCPILLLLLPACGVGVVDFGTDDSAPPPDDTARPDSGDTAAVVDTGAPSLGPDIRVYPTAVEVGLVVVGCHTASLFALENWGDGDLQITGVGLSAASTEFTLLDAEADNGPLPWSIPPGGQRELQVLYTPVDQQVDVAYLTVESDDPDESEVAAGLVGNGNIVSTVTDSWDLPGPDVLVVLDTSASMDIYQNDIAAAFPSLLESLQAGGSDFRLSVVVHDSGCVQGSVLYLDPDTAPSAGEAAYDAMVATTGPGIDAERAFTLLQAAIAQTDDGGCNEGLLRSGHPLHLLAISDEAEQSLQPWENHVDQFQALMEDPEDFHVHAIGGGGVGCGVLYAGIYEASATTGGLYLSLCAALDDNMEALGTTITDMGIPTHLPLSRSPVPGTVELSADGVPLTWGWTWSSDDNEVLLDPALIPADTTLIEVSFVPVPDDCED